MISDFLHNSDNSQEVIDFDKLQKLLSKSTFYEFYIARLWHKKVFVKRLKAQYRENPFYLAALKKEFEIGVSLNHPSIPVYRDYKNGAVFIDYIEGDTLSDIIISGKLSKKSGNIKKYIYQLIEVVDYLHRNNITHCDIKADNIIITRGSDNVMLIDFDKCHTDAYDNTRANPENFGIAKNIEVSSDFDYHQISLIIKEIMPLVSKYQKKRLNLLVSAIQKGNVDLEEVERLLNRKLILNKFIIGLGLIIILFISVFIGLFMIKKTPSENSIKKEVNESYPVEKELADSIHRVSIYENKKVTSESVLEKVSLPEEKKETLKDSKDEIVVNNRSEDSINKKGLSDFELDKDAKKSVEHEVQMSSNNNKKESMEIIINRRMEVLLKPYAEYLDKYEKALGNQNISYEELTSVAQGSTDMLVKTMENACSTLYKEFPDIEKIEIQKLAWISVPYLNLVNRNIDISERYGKRVLKNINQ